MTTKAAEHVAKEIKRADILSTTIRTHNSSVAPELDRQTALVTREGETMIEAASEQERNARIVDQASHELNEFGQDLHDAIADRVQHVEERDMWFSISRGELFSVKTTVQAQGGQDAVTRLGLRGPLADSPEGLILQGQHFHQKLASPANLRTKTEGITIDKASLSTRLETPFSELELRQGLYLEAGQRVGTARKAKDDALGRLRLINRTIAQETIATYRRAGFPGLAETLRRDLSRVLKSKPPGQSTTPPVGQDTSGTSDTTPPDTTPPDTTPDTTPPDTTPVAETPDGTTPSDAAMV